jgi:hypothetical protein
VEFNLEAEGSAQDKKRKMCGACVGAIFPRVHTLAVEEFIVQLIVFFVVVIMKIVFICCWNVHGMFKLRVMYTYGIRLIELSAKIIIWMLWVFFPSPTVTIGPK